MLKMIKKLITFNKETNNIEILFENRERSKTCLKCEKISKIFFQNSTKMTMQVEEIFQMVEINVKTSI